MGSQQMGVRFGGLVVQVEAASGTRVRARISEQGKRVNKGELGGQPRRPPAASIVKRGGGWSRMAGPCMRGRGAGLGPQRLGRTILDIRMRRVFDLAIARPHCSPAMPEFRACWRSRRVRNWKDCCRAMLRNRSPVRSPDDHHPAGPCLDASVTAKMVAKRTR